jgi:hypothetical protein
MNPSNSTCQRFAAQVISYVQGALTGAEAERLEEHVAACADCARLMAEEAQLEMRLHELGASAGGRRTREPVAVASGAGHARWVVAPAAALVVLVATLLVRSKSPPLSRGPETQDPQDRRPPVTCLQQEDAARCREDAARRGLRIDYPPAMAGIPRYETLEPTYGASGPAFPALRRARLSFD